MTTQRGIKLYCPNCKAFSKCISVPLYKLNEPKAQRWYRTDHQDIQWFRRGRECLVCGHKFVTAEIDENFIEELVKLRELAIQKNKRKISELKNRTPWLKRAETIPKEVAVAFIRNTTWWHSHSSGRPVRAPNHSDRIYMSHHGWTLDFGANSFLIGVAIERCRNTINDFFDKSLSGEAVTLDSIKQKLKLNIRGAVANKDGYEYNGYYPLDGGDMMFGVQSIDVDDGVRFIIERANLTALYE